MILVLMGVEIDLEVLTDKGIIDGVLELDDKIYLIEFKYGKADTKMENLIDKALEQKFFCIFEKQGNHKGLPLHPYINDIVGAIPCGCPSFKIPTM